LDGGGAAGVGPDGGGAGGAAGADGGGAASVMVLSGSIDGRHDGGGGVGGLRLGLTGGAARLQAGPIVVQGDPGGADRGGPRDQQEDVVVGQHLGLLADLLLQQAQGRALTLGRVADDVGVGAAQLLQAQHGLGISQADALGQLAGV